MKGSKADWEGRNFGVREYRETPPSSKPCRALCRRAILTAWF